MGIRIKLILPAAAAFLIFASVLHLYWAPRSYDHARTDFITQMENQLAVLENDLVRHLLAGDYSALYASLHYQEKLHKRTWQSLALCDEHHKQVYPLGQVRKKEVGGTREFTIPMEHQLDFNGRILGRIEVAVNWFETYEQERQRILELEIYLAITLTLLFLTQLYWEHKVITQPISELNRATEKLSEGDFSAVLPLPATDEIGQLTQSFHQMRKNLLAAQEDLKKKTREALEASRAKSHFVATMSHEIRTPMNGISGMTQVLAKTDLDTEQKGMVELLTVSCNTLSAVLNDILDFSKIEAGKMALDLTEVNLERLLKDSLALLATMAQDKGLALEMRYSPDCPVDVKADGGRIRQILLNLLSNGIKFTEKGYVRVDVSCTDQNRETCRVRFRVSDTGVGIAPEKHQDIFDAFTQADASTTRTHGGTGLGLAISSRLVALMGSSLQLESVPENGAVFSFELVLEKSCKVEQKRAAPRPEFSEDLFSGRHLLVVEDNLVNQKVVEKMLAPTGIGIDFAGDGRKALDLVAQTAYDLILMDYQMPVMDGIAATREIRNRERRNGQAPVPIIALTANALRQNEENCLQAGMNGFIAKPVTMNALIGVLHRFLS